MFCLGKFIIMERCLIRQNSVTFDILRTFQSSVVAKLSDLKNSLVFWPTLYRQFCRQPKCRSVFNVSGFLLTYGQTMYLVCVTCLLELRLRCTVALYLAERSNNK